MFQLTLAAFAIANTIDLCPARTMERRGVPLAFHAWKDHTAIIENMFVRAMEYPHQAADVRVRWVSSPPEPYEFHTRNFLIDLFIALALSGFIGFASERLVFKKLRDRQRAARSV